jgi:uncharacterized protein (DUF427 family)
MSLTLPGAPLWPDLPETVNFTIDGPKHRLFAHPYPRRVRATFGGEVVLDTDRGVLLHESALQPVLYAPWQDIRQDLLTGTDHHTTCPFKGIASYWSIRVNGHEAENAVWSYPEPNAESPWLEPLAAFYWDRVDAWYDEEDRVYVHLRDPYHRIDARRTSRPVRVTAAGELLAETRAAYVLSENGLPNRWYLPREDCRLDLLQPTATSTHCPYKGTANYWTLASAPDQRDVAWSYERPFPEATPVARCLSFYGEAVEVRVGDAVVDTAWPPRRPR